MSELFVCNTPCSFIFATGQPAKTIFKRLHYDPTTDTSVLHCMHLPLTHETLLTPYKSGRPLTGRCP